VQSLCAVLQGVTSPDNAQRKAAEQALETSRFAPRQVVMLLQACCAEGLDLALRQAAAIQFKQTVAQGWLIREPGKPGIPDEDKLWVKGNVLQGMTSCPPKIRSQLTESFKTIVDRDFPMDWPALLPAVIEALGSAQDPKLMHGALSALRCITRKYEFKDEDERQELQQVVALTFPKLLALLQQLTKIETDSVEIAELMRLVIKIFWSSCYLNVPPYLHDPAVLQGWMECIYVLLLRPVPTQGQPTDEAERMSWQWWKVKKWTMHLCNRFYSRYGDPRLLRDEDKVFGNLWRKGYANQFLEGYLLQAANLHKPGTAVTLPGRILNLNITYITTAIGKKSGYKVLEPRLNDILINLVFPVTCFNASDLALWVEDPHEYIRKGYDIVEDMYSPRTAATNFIIELTDKRKKTLQPFLAFIIGVFDTYASTPPEQRNHAQFDGALLAIGSLSDKLKETKGYKESLEPLLVQHIVPQFGNANGYIRAKACWIAGSYADVEFKNPNNFLQLFHLTLAAMRDPELPVRVDALVAIRSFVEQTEDLEVLRPVLPQILTNFFNVMGEVENEDLVFTLETIVERFGEEIAPYALGLTQSLAQAFWKCHGADDDAEADEDDGTSGMAAIGCIRAIITVLESVSTIPAHYAQLEAQLVPIMDKILQNVGDDIFEEILEMLSYLTFFSPVISDQLWALWPHLIQALEYWAFDYFENILIPLDNFITRGTEKFLSNPAYLSSVGRVVEKFLKPGSVEDGDAEPAAKLACVVLQGCRGRVDAVVEPFLLLALQRLQTAKRRDFKTQLLLVLANALYYNPVLTLQTLQKMQALAPALQALHGALVARKNEARAHFKRETEKKEVVLGLVSVLLLPAEALPLDLQAGMGGLLSATVSVLKDLKEQNKIRKESEEAQEKGGGFAYDEDDEEDEEDDEAPEDEEEEEEEEGKTGGRRGRNQVQRAIGHAQHFRFPGQGEDEDDDDDDDDDWDDEEEECSSALDTVDPFHFFRDGLMSVSQADPTRFAFLTSGLDPAGTVDIKDIMEYAATLPRPEAAAAA